MTQLTPTQRLKWALLHNCGYAVEDTSPEGIEARFVESANGPLDVNEARWEGVDTNLYMPDHVERHYECDQKALQCPDGQWVGYPLYYGGGKHSCPEEIPWLSRAYIVECREEMRLVQTFTAKG